MNHGKLKSVIRACFRVSSFHQTFSRTISKNYLELFPRTDNKFETATNLTSIVSGTVLHLVLIKLAGAVKLL